MKVKVHDSVLITAGKYRGKTGTVLRTMKKRNSIVVEKVNIRTRHIKKSQGKAGERIQYEAPMDASNAAVICPQCKKATRVGYVVPEKGAKQRICKKCNQGLDQKKAISKKK